MESVKAYAFRLKPGQDLQEKMQKLVNEKQIKAVGSALVLAALQNTIFVLPTNPTAAGIAAILKL
ncbi:MAG: hypothetical protein WDM90_10970 [Ferruginibacter sp.]